MRFERISEDQGLSQYTVSDILQDRDGYLWFATAAGLNRYDGIRFEVFSHDPRDPESLPGDWIISLHQDHLGYLWVGTHDDGLARYNPETGKFLRFSYDVNRAGSISSNRIWHISQDSRGYLWVGAVDGLDRIKIQETYDPATAEFEHYLPGDVFQRVSVNEIIETEQGMWMAVYNGGLVFMDKALDEIEVLRHDPDDPQGLLNDRVKALVKADDGKLWVGTRGGLSLFDPETRTFEHYLHDPSDPQTLSGNQIQTLAWDDSGKLWVGTLGQGLNLLDPATGLVQRLAPDTSGQGLENFRVSARRLLAIFPDSSGVIWFGTERGLYKYANRSKAFYHYSEDKFGVPAPRNVRSLYVENKENLWLGTMDDGLVHVDREQQVYTSYRHDPQDSGSLPSNVIWSLYKDNGGQLWASTFMGLARFDRQKGRFRTYSTKDGLSRNNAGFLLQDHDGMYWSGVRGGGLNLFTIREDGSLDATNLFGRHKLRSWHYVNVGLQAQDGSILIGNGAGLLRFEKQDGKPVLVETLDEVGKPGQLAGDQVLVLFQSRDGTLWVGTYGTGLNRLDPGSTSFRWYLKGDGLPGNNVKGLIEDPDGMLWITTDSGLCRLNPDTDEIHTFDVRDGLATSGFELNCHGVAENGEIFVGGLQGLSSFLPHEIRLNSHIPPVVITEITRLGERIAVGSDLRFTHKDNLLTFSFAALDYNAPDKNRYAYHLEGMTPGWVASKTGLASFTNLKPGNYTLHLKGSNNDGVWNEAGTKVHFLVAPPPWLSAPAIGTYLILALVAIFLFYRWTRMRATVAQLNKVDRLKDEIMANTSHELRTPLNGVVGIVESLLDGAAGALPRKVQEDLAMVLSSGRRLTHLVNDILDFSQLKTANLQLARKAVDVRTVSQLVLALCRPLVGKRSVALRNEVSEELPAVFADENRLQQILYNLVGNALKFTHEGEVVLTAEVVGDLVIISVTDTGIGIEPEAQDAIFESFKQADGSISRNYGGTGLGLAITEKLVRLHGGRIFLDSEPGKGSCFSFSVPLASGGEARASLDLDQKTDVVSILEGLDDETEVPGDHQEVLQGEFRILVVDDEPVNRRVLINHLSTRGYRVDEVANGDLALELLEKEPYDLVLLDLMMPRTSGYQVCRTLRQKLDLHQLSIIILTARNQIKDLGDAFAIGANDFLTKPVNKVELLSRVETQLHLVDVGRNLEEKVREATQELREKNEQILRAQNRLVVQEKMSFLGTLTAGVAHELQNPLNFVQNFTELAMEAHEDVDEALELLSPKLSPQELAHLREALEDLKSSGESVHKHALRAAEIVKSMMAFSKDRNDTEAQVGFNEFVGQYARMALANRGLDETKIKVRWVLDQSLGRVRLFPGDLSQALVVLIDNSLDAHEAMAALKKDHQGILEIETRQNASHVMVTLRDNGIGIAPEHHSKIFAPFFTTKKDQANIGLGLSLCYDMIVHGSQGELTFESVPRKGTAFTICLPKKDGVSASSNVNLASSAG